MHLLNCIFSDNFAFRRGGAISVFDSEPEIENCTFTMTSAGTYGGGIYCERIFTTTHPVLNNCIMWGDLPAEIYLKSGKISVTYSDVQGGWEGTGNIDALPYFKSYKRFDFLLSPGSPCIDTGDPSIEDGPPSWHWPPQYQNGKRSDMGAYGGRGNVKWFK
jgi:hypothetical protein